MNKEETFTPSKLPSKENQEEALDDIDQVHPKTGSTNMTEEGTTTIKEEAIATLEFSNQVELKTTSSSQQKKGLRP